MSLAPVPYIPVAKTIYVDPDNGSSGGARGQIQKPFATYAQALAVWTPGDTIVVRPGIYTAAMTMPSYTRTIAAAGTPGLSRSSSVVTCTLTAAHAIPVGCAIYVSGATDSSFDGVFAVATASVAGDTTKLTWKQHGSNATTGGGSLTAAGYIRMDDGAVVDVTLGSVANTVAALVSTSKTFTVISGAGEFHGRNGYGVSLSTTTDSRLEITCKEIAAHNIDAGVGMYAGGARTVIIANVAHRIYSERYDAVWIDGAARCFVRAQFLEAGDNCVELSTSQGCHVEADDYCSFSDRWLGVGGSLGGVFSLSTPAAGQSHYIKGNSARTVGAVETGGVIAGVQFLDDGSGRTGSIFYDVRETIAHGGPAISVNNGNVCIVSGRFRSTYTGAGDPEAGQSGYGILSDPTASPIMRFMGECHIIASSAVTTSTFSYEVPITFAGPVRINKASAASVTLSNSILDAALT